MHLPRLTLVWRKAVTAEQEVCGRGRAVVTAVEEACVRGRVAAAEEAGLGGINGGSGDRWSRDHVAGT
jgi:hypothetical protein